MLRADRRCSESGRRCSCCTSRWSQASGHSTTASRTLRPVVRGTQYGVSSRMRRSWWIRGLACSACQFVHHGEPTGGISLPDPQRAHAYASTRRSAPARAESISLGWIRDSGGRTRQYLETHPTPLASHPPEWVGRSVVAHHCRQKSSGPGQHTCEPRCRLDANRVQTRPRPHGWGRNQGGAGRVRP
jgi:hypothetical protein